MKPFTPSFPPMQCGSWLHEPFLQHAARPGAEDARHALAAFLTLRLVDRYRPEAEPSPPLALAYQIKATRDFVVQLDPQNAETGHLLEIIRLAEAAQQRRQRALLWAPLLSYAHWLEQELRLEEAVEVVDTAIGLSDGTAPKEEIAAFLQRGRILRQLGFFPEAREAYETARQKARARRDGHSVLLARIGLAIVLRQEGKLEASERSLRKILADARRAKDRDAQARASHDLGGALIREGRPLRAVPFLYDAFELYERQSDKLRALSDVGEAMKEAGRYAASKDAFELVLKNETAMQVRAVTMIGLLELSALTGDRVGFAAWAKQLRALEPDLPPGRQVDLKLQLGLGYAAFGQGAKARDLVEQALNQASLLGLGDLEQRAAKALQSLRRKPARTRVPRRLARAGNDAKVREVAIKLRLLRAS